ncbi:adipogenesis regulatory factor isoform X1 [Scyliorhinus torazame]|uniref:adipogenesis regulatory factor isoform X1 n=1 Tax=Scyliorhinus torazame TaxID=75743 RepID=UPI003B5A48FD
MASMKKSLEELKNTTQTAAKGMAGTTVKLFPHLLVQAAQEAVQQVAESSKETTRTATEEASKQTQTAINSVASKAQDSIKGFGQRLVQK